MNPEVLDGIAPHASRSIQLGLTYRWAKMLRSILRAARNKCHKAQQKSAFVPAPGKHDANLMRIAALDDLLKQLDAALHD